MSNKLCENCISVKVCTHNLSIKNVINKLDVAIRYPAGEVSDHHFDDGITRDLQKLKEHALKITGKRCEYFKRVV